NPAEKKIAASKLSQMTNAVCAAPSMRREFGYLFGGDLNPHDPAHRDALVDRLQSLETRAKATETDTLSADESRRHRHAALCSEAVITKRWVAIALRQ